MSYLSLLLTSQIRNLSKVFSTNGEPEQEPLPPLWPDAASEVSDDCTLPLGVVSLEHWLDLNA